DRPTSVRDASWCCCLRGSSYSLLRLPRSADALAQIEAAILHLPVAEPAVVRQELRVVEAKREEGHVAADGRRLEVGHQPPPEPPSAVRGQGRDRLAAPALVPAVVARAGPARAGLARAGFVRAGFVRADFARAGRLGAPTQRGQHAAVLVLDEEGPTGCQPSAHAGGGGQRPRTNLRVQGS